MSRLLDRDPRFVFREAIRAFEAAYAVARQQPRGSELGMGGYSTEEPDDDDVDNDALWAGSIQTRSRIWTGRRFGSRSGSAYCRRAVGHDPPSL